MRKLHVYTNKTHRDLKEISVKLSLMNIENYSRSGYLYKVFHAISMLYFHALRSCNTFNSPRYCVALRVWEIST